MVTALLEGAAEEITGVIIEQAKKGDLAAAKLVLERLAPPVRERPISIALPDAKDIADIDAAQQAILAAVAQGEILPAEATALAGVVEARRKAIETLQMEQRITALERQAEQRKGR